MGTRKLSPGKYQGVVGSGRAGQTRATFSTRKAAQEWAADVVKRRGPVRPPRKSAADDDLPVGVTHSKAKWYARSPRSFPTRIVRVFAEARHGAKARAMALAVAAAWLKVRRRP